MDFCCIKGKNVQLWLVRYVAQLARWWIFITTQAKFSVWKWLCKM